MDLHILPPYRVPCDVLLKSVTKLRFLSAKLWQSVMGDRTHIPKSRAVPSIPETTQVFLPHARHSNMQHEQGLKLGNHLDIKTIQDSLHKKIYQLPTFIT